MIDIKMKNMDQLMKVYGKVGQIVQKEMKDALNKSAAVVERAAKKKTPVDSGHLRRSIQKSRKAKAGESKVFVGSDVRYALKQHEGEHFKHRTGEAKFLDKALRENERKVMAFFKQMINNIIKKLAKYK